MVQGIIRVPSGSRYPKGTLWSNVSVFEKEAEWMSRGGHGREGSKLTKSRGGK